MSTQRKVIINNHEPNINWEQVYQDFKARFTAEVYDSWRLQFNMDALKAVASLPRFNVGQIVPIWDNR